MHETIWLDKATNTCVLRSGPPLNAMAAKEAAGSGGRLALLAFTRCPKELREVMLASPLAARLEAQGIDVEPDKSAGGLGRAHTRTKLP